MYEIKKYSAGVLVIGGGIAGLFAAITAKSQGCDVLLADKAYAGKSGASIMASGQLNVYNPEWSGDFETLYKGQVRIGEYLNHREWLRTIMLESWGIYENMRDWGVEFPCPEEEFPTFMAKMHGRIKPDGQPDPELAAKRPAMLDMIPLKHREVPTKLRKYADKIGVRFLDRTMITELTKNGKRVCGAIGFDIETGTGVQITTGAVVMAAGKNCFRAPGMNVAELTGDADAMAYRAGALISGKEFPDMHTGVAKHTVWKGTGEIYPAYWRFVDCDGNYANPGGYNLSMAAMVHAGRGPIMWDFENMTQEDVDRIERYLTKRDMRHEGERINLGYYTRTNERTTGGATAGSPAEQSAGIFPVDMDCSSTVPGLFTAGDCCSSYAWGAINAGGPPGILPAAVQGKRAGAGAVKFAQSNPPTEAEVSFEDIYAPINRRGGYDPRWVCQLLQSVMMPYYVIHIKKGDRLQAALTNVEFFRDHMVPRLFAADVHELRLCHEVKNMVLNAEMILRSSLERTESRGWHYREDYPHHDDENWLAWVTMEQKDGFMSMGRIPVKQEWLDEDPVENRYDTPTWQV